MTKQTEKFKPPFYVPRPADWEPLIEIDLERTINSSPDRRIHLSAIDRTISDGAEVQPCANK
jgi:hypothetical protein